ncbi:hypothetical protein [Accumulibacter sp.]|uniref:hypothetical protein n=1 Tax=Accumulibacter sp. TaxID=2053492 RepID=UPI002621F314|nr:hypothetical protein [Accumulibacter sp.]
MQNRSNIVWVLAVTSWDVAAAGVMTLGFHAHDPSHIEAAAATGYSAIRLWDSGTDWANLKPQPDLWKFDRINAYLAASKKAHLRVLWTIGKSPRWASARPNELCAYGFGCASEPANIDDWRRYVRTIATTFRGQVECYEPWNEVSFPNDPDFTQPGAGGKPAQFFTGSVAAMVNLARVAYEEIKRADPQACVLSPSFHSSGNWAEKFDRYLTAGGGKYCDVVSQHFYFSEEPEQAVRLIRRMRRVMEAHGLGHVPLWNTEVGVSFEVQVKHWPGLSPEDLVYAFTLRTYLLNASEGVPRVYWYAWDNKNMGYFTSDTNHDFGSAAASAAVHLLDGLKSASCQSKDSVWQCQVSAGGRDFKVVWLAGRTVNPKLIVFKDSAIRWGSAPVRLPAGQQIKLDGRPIIVSNE